MKKITLFILACTLVATSKTMLGAAGAAAAPARSPAEQLYEAIVFLEPSKVKELLETYGTEAYAVPLETYNVHPWAVPEIVEEMDGRNPTATNLLSSDTVLKWRLDVISDDLTPKERKQVETDHRANWAEIQEIWQEYQKSLPARPVAVPAVAPQ